MPYTNEWYIGSTHLLFFNFRSVPFHSSSIQLNGNWTEKERDWNRNGTGTEWEWNGIGMGMERERNRNGTNVQWVDNECSVHGAWPVIWLYTSMGALNRASIVHPMNFCSISVQLPFHSRSIPVPFPFHFRSIPVPFQSRFIPVPFCSSPFPFLFNFCSIELNWNGTEWNGMERNRNW